MPKIISKIGAARLFFVILKLITTAIQGVTAYQQSPINLYFVTIPILQENLAMKSTIVALFLCLGLLVLFSQCAKEPTPEPNTVDTQNGPAAGNPNGTATIPTGGEAVDVSNPDIVIGDGTPQSCTCQAVLNAVAQGGKITFDCGPDPHVINMTEPAKIYNNARPEVVLDGGGLITLSGGGRNRILYMNTCDADLVYTTPHCQNQDHPRVTVQNITFADGNSRSETTYEGGGAIWARGGRFKAVNARFFNNTCATEGPDVGGGALRVFDQYNDQPVYLTNCTFGGADGYGNWGANGGAISSIGVSWTITNSLFSHNRAVGNGGNPAQSGTPGGGSGGAIYNDGNTMTLSLDGCLLEHNEVIQHGASIFFVTNDRSGNIVIDNSTIQNNTGGSWYPVYPSISMHANTQISVSNSTIE